LVTVFIFNAPLIYRARIPKLIRAPPDWAWALRRSGTENRVKDFHELVSSGLRRGRNSPLATAAGNLRLIVHKFTKLGLPLWCSHCQESPVLKVE
jgi:hypothetical protein